MITLEDFTVLPLDRFVPLEGRVETCPVCGRRGIEEHPECGRPYFLHRQATQVQADGMLTDPFDSCALLPN